jgi:hypothetical protein
MVCAVAAALIVPGCGRGEADAPQRSKVVSPESVEYQAAKAAQDEFKRQGKEAERKALGGHAIE